MGPTAVGKTTITASIARHFNSVVLNADSRQVYKELEIGTAAPTAAEMQGVKHYFVRDRSIHQPVTAGQFAREALDVLEKEFKTHASVFLSGGSGLYIKAVTEGLDTFPEIPHTIREELEEGFRTQGLASLIGELESKDPVYFKEVDKNNPQRVMRALEVIRHTGKSFSSFRKGLLQERPFRIVKIGLNMPREALYNRINLRMEMMLNNGLEQEALGLKAHSQLEPLRTVGYQEVFAHHEGSYDREEMIRLLKQNSRRYAKRQLTWWRKDPDIVWFHPEDIFAIVQHVESKLS